MLRPRCRIYSVGYEGTTAEELADRLARHGVSLLVDVRLQPWSRRPGFSKQPLSVALAMAGIEYVHEPQFGNPHENRDAYRRGDPAAMQVMQKRLEERKGQLALDKLIREARYRDVAVLCVERESSRCHRRVITDMAKDRVIGLEVVDLDLLDAEPGDQAAGGSSAQCSSAASGVGWTGNTSSSPVTRNTLRIDV
jgi:uncharacterized protein (DUF488 family)